MRLDAPSVCSGARPEKASTAFADARLTGRELKRHVMSRRSYLKTLRRSDIYKTDYVDGIEAQKRAELEAAYKQVVDEEVTTARDIIEAAISQMDRLLFGHILRGSVNLPSIELG